MDNSQANLKKEVRILDDQVSRIFLVVESDINPTTFEIVKKNRHSKEFKDDLALQQLLDHSEHRGPYFGYVSMAFEREYIDESAMYAAETALRYTQRTIIKMHKYVMENYELTLPQSFKANMNSENRKEILDERRELETEIIELLKEANSEFTLDDVKETIYNEKENDDMQDVIAMFNTGEPNAPHMGTIVEMVTDAWNCFPHKALSGLSPKEILLNYEEKDKRKDKK